jgi:hypothetical protein
MKPRITAKRVRRKHDHPKRHGHRLGAQHE